jgi:hypothetical protein
LRVLRRVGCGWGRQGAECWVHGVGGVTRAHTECLLELSSNAAQAVTKSDAQHTLCLPACLLQQQHARCTHTHTHIHTGGGVPNTPPRGRVHTAALPLPPQPARHTHEWWRPMARPPLPPQLHHPPTQLMPQPTRAGRCPAHDTHTTHPRSQHTCISIARCRSGR